MNDSCNEHVRLPREIQNADENDASGVDAWRMFIQRKSYRTSKVFASRFRILRILKLLWCSWPVEQLQSVLQYFDQARAIASLSFATERIYVLMEMGWPTLEYIVTYSKRIEIVCDRSKCLVPLSIDSASECSSRVTHFQYDEAIVLFKLANEFPNWLVRAFASSHLQVQRGLCDAVIENDLNPFRACKIHLGRMLSLGYAGTCHRHCRCVCISCAPHEL